MTESTFGSQFAPLTLTLVKPGLISTRAVVATVALSLLSLPILTYVKNIALELSWGLGSNTVESVKTAR